MNDTQATGPTESPGLAQKLMNSPVVAHLADEAKNYAKARVEELGGRLGEQVTSLADRMNSPGGQGLLSGVGKLAEGKPLGSAAFSSVTTNLKERTKSVFGGSGGDKSGGGGQGGPPKAINIVENIDIGLPVDVVYNQWTQYDKFADFMKGVQSVEATSETETTWRVKVFKSQRSWKATTLEQIPDRRIAWTSEGGKGSTKGVVTFHPLADDLTRVLLVMEYYPSGFFEKTGNLWRAPGRRARLDLKHFRRYLMMNGEETGAWRGEIRDKEVVRQPDEEPEATSEESGGVEDQPADQQAPGDQDAHGGPNGASRGQPGGAEQSGEQGADAKQSGSRQEAGRR